MSGAGRDVDGLAAGTSGSQAMGDRDLGTAGVHTGLHSGGARDAYAGLGFADAATGARAGGVREETPLEGADSMGGRARHLAEDLGHRATDAASMAREKVSGLRDRANQVLERRGLVERLRENPLPVLGVAFAVGFLVSGSDDRHTDSRAARARRELRSALMAGLSAGLAQGARGFLSEAGNEGSGFLQSLLDNLAGGQEGRGGENDAFSAGGRGRGPAYGGGTAGPSYARDSASRSAGVRDGF